MFQDASLWEAGILLIGIAFVISSVYLAMTLSKLSKTMQDVNAIIAENKKSIEMIMIDVESITKNASKVTDDVQQSVGAIKNSVVNVEKTVKTSKNFILSPLYKTVNYSHAFIKAVNKLTSKKRR
ncbi:MAG: DUF948 domain-containing protein [Eubacteriaceae bacterium]|nr:DUF948 domain-containing protein [Eubacteriaceae bacterium]